MIEVFRGSPNTWECDEMGHMNVRFYVAKMMEGLAEFAHVAAMPHAFRSRAPSTLRPRDQHIRFLREAHAGAPFTMTACVLEIAESAVLVYQQLTHISGEPCAAFRTWVDHVDVETGRPFPWSPATLEKLQSLTGEAPADLGPRSLDLAAAPFDNPTLAGPDAIQAPLIGRGVIQPQHCDLTGAMMPEFFIGRMSDSVGHILRPWRAEVAASAAARGETVRMGGAALEYRLVYRRWPRAGDRFIIRSGSGFQKEKVHSFVHWMLDPETGLAWCTAEVVAVALNLETRKILPATPEQLAALARVAPKGLKV